MRKAESRKKATFPLLLAAALTSPAFAIYTPNEMAPGPVEQSTSERGYSLWAAR